MKYRLNTLTCIAIAFTIAGCTASIEEKEFIANSKKNISEPVSTDQITPSNPLVVEAKPGKQQQEKIALSQSDQKQEISNSAPEAKQKARRRENHLNNHLMADESVAGRTTINSLAKIAPATIIAAPFPQGVPQQWRMPSEAIDRENYAHLDINSIKKVSEDPVSTFSIDVDTGSYTNVRRILRSGQLPRIDAVRVEEFINYFNYQYPAPKTEITPFNVVTEIGPSPWSKDAKLLHIGIKGYEVAKENLPPANLVFLIDASGSMQSANKLGLLKNSLKLLTKKLRTQDRISIVVYAGASGILLEPVSGQEKYKILATLNSLTAGGRTNGAAGIRDAYAMAESAFIEGGINRVILATDGDFNVGTINFEALKDLIKEKRKSGVTLTTLGFGTGNYNDQLMEQLADVGNGNYAYIDSLNEAQKVLIDEMGSTLQTIAKDVKIQVEFNPGIVSEYRLIGYENRALRREDFNNDKIDAGEIGAGHTVTAIYEISLLGSESQQIDPLRYKSPQTDSNQEKEIKSTELAFLKLRYKKPGGNKSTLIKKAITRQQIKDNINHTSKQYQFSASVAAFAQLLRGGQFTQQFNLNDVLNLARKSKGNDNFGYRSEFIQLVNLTTTLTTAVKVSQLPLK